MSGQSPATINDFAFDFWPNGVLRKSLEFILEKHYAANRFLGPLVHCVSADCWNHRLRRFRNTNSIRIRHGNDQRRDSPLQRRSQTVGIHRSIGVDIPMDLSEQADILGKLKDGRITCITDRLCTVQPAHITRYRGLTPTP